MSRQALLAALAAAITTTAVAPAAAEAAAIRYVETEDGPGYVVTTDPGVDDVITVHHGVWRGAERITFGTIDGPTRIDEHPGCEVDPMGGHNCPVADAQFILIDGGAGNDTLRGELEGDRAVRLPMFLLGGPGDDQLVGGLASDALLGDEGADKLQDTPGRDGLDAGAGDDQVTSNGPNAKGDVFEGGGGTDTIIVGRGAAHTWTLDEQANDGEAGEGDNALNFENIGVGSEAPADITGDDGPNRIDGGTSGTHVLRGLGGDDHIKGSQHADRIEGGAGDDTLRGEEGDDHLDGGPGSDSILGDAQNNVHGFQAGNDVVQARDGEVDTIDCGIGADRAIVDHDDVVANCVSVDRAPGPPTPPGPGTGGPGTGGPGTGGPGTGRPGTGGPTPAVTPRLVLTPPARDRRAPYRFTLRGRAADAPGCAGRRVAVVVRKGSRVVLRRRATLGSRCTFAVGLRLKARGRHTATVTGAGLRAKAVLRAG